MTGDPAAEAEDAILDGFVREQAGAVPRTIEVVRTRLSAWPPLPASVLLLVGSGTSLNALVAAKPVFEAPGRMVEAMNPGAFMRRDWSGMRDALVIVLSQTGTSETSVAALRFAQEAGLPAIAVTAEEASPIARVARRLLPIPVGPEPVGPKTKGYTASLAALFEIAAWLDGRPAQAAVDGPLVQALLAAAAGPAHALADSLDDLDFLAVVGEGRHLGTALEGSLKVTEMAGLPAAAFPVEETLHGRLHGPSPRSLCIWIAADADELRTAVHAAETMEGLGVRIVILNLTAQASPFDWLRLQPALPAPFDTIAAIIPLQRLAEGLARRRGLPPHRMRFPGLSKRLGIKIERLP